MDADQSTNGNPCSNQGPDMVTVDLIPARPGDDTKALESDMLCCICRKLLDEPMLLHCLHNCCRRCLKSASHVREKSDVPLAVENSSTAEVFGLSRAPAFVFQQSSQSTSSVCCQTCMETTSVAAAVDNVFLAAKVRSIKVRRDVAMCAFCCNDEEDVGAARSASFWCGACQSTLCADCVTGLHRKFHKNHLTTSLHEMQCGNQAIGVSTASCVKHGRPYELACFTCETAKCLSCTADCIAARHDMLLLSDPRFASRFAQMKLRVAALASSVSSKSAVLQQHVDVVERLSAARQADLDQLKANKRLVVDAIDQAFQEAEAALKDGYDELEAKALKLRRSAEQQLERMRNAIDYSHQLLAADSDTIALMQQQKFVVSKLQALVKMLDNIPATRDASAFFDVPKCTEGSATQLVISCLPKPLLKYDELCVNLADRVKSSLSFGFEPDIRAPKMPTQPMLSALFAKSTPESKMQLSPLAKPSSSEPAVVSATDAASKPAGTADAATAIGAAIGTWQELFRSTKSQRTLQFDVPPASSGEKKPNSSRMTWSQRLT